MKRTALCFASALSILLFSAAPGHAAEQKVIFVAESIKHESGTGARVCQERCGKRSGPDPTTLVSDGWKIVKSTPKEVVVEQYWYTPCNVCEPHGCSCIGTEYLLERDETVPPVAASNKELDLLKKENELLRQENASLRRENENLANQLKSKQ